MEKYIGTGASRIDGRAKVTGAAKYAAEHNTPGLAHGYVVTSSIAKGRIVGIDAGAALRVAGVLDVFSHQHRPHMARSDEAYSDDAAPKGSPFRPLHDDLIVFNGQPVALVVAEEAEIARYAASLVRVTYEEEPHATDVFGTHEDVVLEPTATPPDSIFGPQFPRGDALAAYAAAAVRHAGEYSTPIEHHNPMELFATTVVWEGGGKLTVHDKTQGVQNVQRYVCSVLELKSEDVRVTSAYMGGGFGAGLRPQYQVVLAVLAALGLERSVRLVLTRQQMYGLGYRPAMIQKIELGATGEGTLDAIAHDAVTITSQYEDFFRQETGWSGLLYKSSNALYRHRLARLDLPTSCDMRCPSAATAMFALESAMDELAIKLEIDPLELRRRCYSDREQHHDRPYSSKNLRACYEEGARAFGWAKRNPAPRSTREGRELVGWGMGSGIWEALQVPVAVRIVLSANGHAEVSSAASDIGTGTYTIMAQVAADMLGLPMESISVRLGDSTLPQCPIEGGSWLAASISNGIVTTAEAIRDEVLKLAGSMPGSPLAGLRADEVELAGGRLVSKRDASRGVSISDAMRHGGAERIDQLKTTKFDDDHSKAHNAHAAVFAEVKVDEEIGIIRVTRVVSAVAAGRILNAKTAHSQIMGGVVWGIGMALHEQTVLDHGFGRVMNADLAEYAVPVHADVHDIEVIFVEEQDPTINGLGVKGLGEIGIVGVAAAIANAVYHATGTRVRDLPITLDKLRR
ncbi:xanthine dehydrogenase family protein molybdopterin-binding subunit [Starkeya sp. ORNL1]|uniref:xanthine dehydrogenase family protein molybdopterin-binding subunit n=1 Tax=Starkeya sp. ORNL1 TaxID=2709380 RepID=UPI0014636F67|nr:xanthine dehydrogenase family protein molybdopterin-binding subunit [Starkeya sp. ORNL1]QJP13746.1 xanthine dehydrogenase family protein molybdopterin-binding subunit [Starkeya sp. ORNL1]